MSEEGKVIYCSFCGKSQNEAVKIVAGDDACICNECIYTCVGILVGAIKDNPRPPSESSE